MEQGWAQPVGVGLVTALVGFTSSFAVVLAGLQAVGATTAQAASGLATLCVLQGAGTLWLSLRHRRPLTLAWSTPGAALLVSAAGLQLGWSAAVGAFVVCGLLLAVTGLWPWLGRTVAAIPAPLAQAMLAGVLLTLCIQPVVALSRTPVLVAPVILLWLVLQRYAPRWSAPAAFALALALIVGVAVVDGSGVSLQAPTLSFTAPGFSWPAVVGLALPLYVVTMAAQNVPGVAVLAAAGYRVPWRQTLLLTGAGTVAGAGAGAHAVNLAAITAALPASAEAHPDPERRWIAAATAGVAYLALAPAAATLAGLMAQAPPGVIESVAGLALVGTLAASLAAATADPAERLPAVAAFLVAAGGVSMLGIGAAFWALLAGLALRLVLRPRARQSSPV
ncbi:benzoate/H(+) symporter BenE family transporter [Nakamurella sp.]|uniref:benzoate/H(+) symporter BenE family transporter n=1 Tax=Nakamurella sp. TaxID=1869182 RepID=UPI003B3A8646